MAKEFEIIPHTADLKIRAFGTTLQELFKNALKGMFSSIKPKSENVKYEGENLIVNKFSVERKVNVISENREMLLVDFLSECLYLSDVNDEAYFDAKFTVFDETELEAYIYGVKVTGFEESEIKAVTYHELSFENTDGLWQTTIVFDI